jgi:two-component system sensor histidine kinase KdpD
LIYSVVNSFEDKLQTHHVKIQIDEKLPLFKLDFGLIQQVLHNLISNAIIYTDADSAIGISADILTEVKGHFIMSGEKLHPHRDGMKSSLLLEISDNGKGFPLDEIGNVFNKFYRLKNSKAGGTGLGLSIAKGFIEAHDGRIDLTNIPDGGAIFSIRIPSETTYLK